MASIRKRRKKNGELSYYADIVIKKHGEIVHREGRSFSKLALAKAWAAKRELELQEADVFKPRQKLIISELITDYMQRFDCKRSKRCALLALSNTPLASKDAYKLTSADIIAHCSERLKTAKPQTVKTDVVWLKTVLSTMKGVHGYDYTLDPLNSANIVMRKEGMIAGSDKRSRRPTSGELWALSRYFYGRGPYLHIFWFALFSSRRLSEICSLRWDDINHEHRTILVRNMKTPAKKELTLRAKLPRSAYKLIMRQPRNGALIFPYNTKTISCHFTKTCKILGIDDLHFHDARHHAVSSFFEKGLSIQEVCKISLHQSWSNLKIYTNLRPEDIDI
jgi:integrase